MSETMRRIEDKIKSAPSLKIFSIYDFLNYGSYEAVKKSLLRLEKRHWIKHITLGIYYKADIPGEIPDIDDTASAIAKKFHWSISPSGERCLEILSLDSPEHDKCTFLSSGPYRSYEVCGRIIQFKKTSRRDIENLSPETKIIVQAMKARGEENITEEDLAAMRRSLSENERENIKEECRFCTRWIYRLIKKEIAK